MDHVCHTETFLKKKRRKKEKREEERGLRIFPWFFYQLEAECSGAHRFFSTLRQYKFRT